MRGQIDLMSKMRKPGVGRGVVAGVVIGSLLVFPVLSQSAQGAASTHKVSPYHRVSQPDSADSFYRSLWGVDNLSVRRTDAGQLIRFSYRVSDPARAKVLGDERSTPSLVAPTRGVALRVPNMAKIGDLRQKGKPVADKEYWMVFSNKGNLVKAGDRVNIVIGSFHADGLMVE